MVLGRAKRQSRAHGSRFQVESSEFLQLKDRVLNDILSPEFAEKESGGFLSRAVFKYRR